MIHLVMVVFTASVLTGGRFVPAYSIVITTSNKSIEIEVGADDCVIRRLTETTRVNDETCRALREWNDDRNLEALRTRAEAGRWKLKLREEKE